MPSAENSIVKAIKTKQEASIKHIEKDIAKDTDEPRIIISTDNDMIPRADQTQNCLFSKLI